MNIAELARKLKISPNELREKLPALGFDIGLKAIKIDDRLASKIVHAYWEFKKREQQKEQYLKITTKDEKGNVVLDKKVDIPSVLTVKDFASLLNLPLNIVIAELMKNGVMASLNQRIDFDTAAIVANELGYEATQIDLSEKVELDKANSVKEQIEAQKQEDLIDRPPIVVVMGHVDHGKTKLLDAIRHTSVMEGEAGGITQHIGAYQVNRKGRLITFIDTPGHEAFTAMRSRGAKVADVTILVVAASEGVKPQTIEALKIAQNAGVPIVVALNKIDLPEANPDRVKQELAQYNLLSEEWGGNTIYVPISAKFGKNIDELLDRVLLIADMNSATIKANPSGQFFGSIIEAHIDKGEGPVATVLVRNGTLKVGDYVAVNGILYGKIRSLRDYKNEIIDKAEPSVPAKILGLKVAPKVGDILEVVADAKKAEKAKVYRMREQDETFIKSNADNSQEDNANVDKLNIILRSDVLGSQEAIIESLKKMEKQNFKINIIAKGLGNINESDVLSSEATGAQILGFNVLTSASAASLAKEKKIVIKNYKIIYQLLDEVKILAKSVIKAQVVREDMGKVSVLALFKKADKWQVVGGRVNAGKIEANCFASVLRNNEFVTTGKITELKVGKEAVSDAVRGQEFGLKFEGQPLIEVGDILDVYKEKEVKTAI